MSAIGGHRAVAGCGGGLCGSDRQHRNPTNGRQGKRPACGSAYVVGKIEVFSNATTTSCWRFLQIVKRFQASERRRRDLPQDLAP